MSTPEPITMSPLAFSKICALACVLLKLALTLIVPAKTLIGPAMLVAPPIVMVSVCAVLPMSLPIVKPVTSEDTPKSVMG